MAPNNESITATYITANYDDAWKDALEKYLETFMAFFFPAAHRKTQETTQAFPERLNWKVTLIKRLYKQLGNAQDIVELFRVLDRMVRLPEPLELVFRDAIRKFEEENQMPYLSSFERIGRQESLQQGLQQGLQEGRLEGVKNYIQSLLKNRFGVVDDELAAVIEALAQMPDDEAVRLLLTSSREELVARFGQNPLHG